MRDERLIGCSCPHFFLLIKLQQIATYLQANGVACTLLARSPCSTTAKARMTFFQPLTCLIGQVLATGQRANQGYSKEVRESANEN